MIKPGPIDTGWMTSDLREQLVARQPTGRLGTPADIADTVGFLLSEHGQWITGQLINCNGGYPRWTACGVTKRDSRPDLQSSVLVRRRSAISARVVRARPVESYRREVWLDRVRHRG